ncbi:MAG TPA: N-acetyl-gamma-glutamyl-phosphate reductase [Candidatus Dormibacteraeota bacterium]|nr:N-acetyl-gamma-glutamyl-phosphate reductase [Candidatus Dormibacteraeota bacterium]
MIRLHVVGASGYAAGEVIRFAVNHPNLVLGALESESAAGRPLGEVFPALRRVDRTFDAPGAVERSLQPGDAVLFGASNGIALSRAPQMVERGAKVVDLSSDFRHDPIAVYGAPERHRAEIAAAKLVANPGCYPTATLLALTPLAAWATQITQIVVDAKSGISGAGRSPKTSSLFCEVDGEVLAYGLQGHRHVPEMTAELKGCGIEAPLLFTPQVVPLKRGMLVNAYAMFDAAPAEEEVLEAYHAMYEREPFVHLVTLAPSLAGVLGTNDAEIHVSVAGNVVRAICAIDNLGKGAATQALQSLNIMLGLPEEEGLDARALIA